MYLVIAHDTLTENAFKHKFYEMCGYKGTKEKKCSPLCRLAVFVPVIHKADFIDRKTTNWK